jgi:hypothetical protein
MSEPEIHSTPAPAHPPTPTSPAPDDDASLAERLTTPRPRNLLFLLAFCVAISVATVVVSVWIYAASGDKYLDRSRPGYISEDVDDETKPTIPDSNFSDSGPVNPSVINDFLNSFDELTEHAVRDQYFSPDSLSDESLGISR